MKKFITIILIAIMALSLSACRVDNTEDYNANKGNEDTIEIKINLDDCYVCEVYYDNTSHSNFNTSRPDLWNAIGNRSREKHLFTIRGYHIENYTIKIYELGSIEYVGEPDELNVEITGFYGTQYADLYSEGHAVEIIESDRLVTEIHGIDRYTLNVIEIYYLNGYGEFKNKDIWTWGELKQLIAEYNSINRR